MILGLTGAFGGGKSTVLRYFSTKNWFIFDADAICHSFYRECPRDFVDGLRTIFGNGIFDKDGKPDKKNIAEVCFSDTEKLNRLTALIYPLLQKKMDESIEFCKKNSVDGVFELPLLYEGGYEKKFDAVLAIWTSPEIRVERLKKRGFTAEDMQKRDAKQMALELKLEKADFALVNDGTPEALYCQLDELLNGFTKKQLQKNLSM